MIGCASNSDKIPQGWTRRQCQFFLCFVLTLYEGLCARYQREQRITCNTLGVTYAAIHRTKHSIGVFGSIQCTSKVFRTAMIPLTLSFYTGIPHILLNTLQYIEKFGNCAD